MMKRSHIRQFLALVDCGSFTQAASRIRVTQPTLSAGIAELERIVGAQLFVRDRRHVRMTEAGGHFLPLARNIDRDFRAADAFGRIAADSWPKLKLGVIRTLSGAHLQTIMTAIAAEFGTELIEGTDAELRAGLGTGRINVAITLIRADEALDQDALLLEEPYQTLVSAEHPLAASSWVRPEQLASEVMIARRSCELLSETSRFFIRHGVRPQFALRSDNDDRCIRMVAAGLGITTAPQSLAIAGTVPINVEGYDFSRRVGLIADPAWLECGDNAMSLRRALAGVDLT